jgi:hypothetical protein
MSNVTDLEEILDLGAYRKERSKLKKLFSLLL